MHILVCSKRDLVANRMLNLMLPAFAGHRVSLLLVNRHRPQVGLVPGLAALREAEEFFPNRTLFPHLEGCTHDAPLLPFGRLCARHGVEIIDGDGLDRAARSALIARLSPDLLLAVKYGYLFTEADLRIPSLGALNLHSGPLPQRPGLHALLRAMTGGEASGPLTIHRLVPDLDRGPVVARGAITLDYGRSYFCNTMRLYDEGAAAMIRLVQAVAAGLPLPEEPQSGAAGPYLGLPGAEELGHLASRGCELVAAVDLIEAVTPYFR